MAYCKYCRRLSYYKCGGNMEPPRHVHPIAEREYDGLDPDYRNWYTLTETGSAVA